MCIYSYITFIDANMTDCYANNIHVLGILASSALNTSPGNKLVFLV